MKELGHKINYFCSDIYQNDLTFGSDTCQIKVGIVQVNIKCSENVIHIIKLFQVTFKRTGLVGGAVPIPSPLAAQQAKAANSNTAKSTPPTIYGELNCGVANMLRITIYHQPLPQ